MLRSSSCAADTPRNRSRRSGAGICFASGARSKGSPPPFRTPEGGDRASRPSCPLTAPLSDSSTWSHALASTAAASVDLSTIHIDNFGADFLHSEFKQFVYGYRPELAPAARRAVTSSASHP